LAIVLNEKGGAVGATYIVGAVLRMPGGSIRAAAWTFSAYIGILVLRFSMFRSLAVLSGKREGDSYLFGAISPTLNFLFSDPQHGAVQILPKAIAGHPGAIVVIVSSLATTLLIVAWAVAQRKRPEAGLLPLLAVALMTTLIFGPYSQKNYIPILALPIYALAVFYAVRWLFDAHHRISVALACFLFLAWGVRFAGLGYYMVAMGNKYQEEWREAEVWGAADEHDPRVAAPIIDRLRREALSRTFPNPKSTLPPFWMALVRGR
jgi:hypothetical protein